MFYEMKSVFYKQVITRKVLLHMLIQFYALPVEKVTTR
jgi:hypothetical protein